MIKTVKNLKFVVHDRPLDYKFMHNDHSRDEKDAILHHLKKNGRLTEETELEKKASKYDFSKTKSGKPVPKQTKPFRMGNEPIGKMKEEVENLEESPKEGAKLKFSGMYNPAPKGTFAYDQAQKVSPLLHSIHKKVDKERNKDLDKFIKGHKQGKLIPTEEDVGDPKAATQSPADGANGGNELSEKKRQMSKSARMIKALYKKKGIVKEDLFDGEKEDKSVKTYGKKPKFDKAEKDEGGENKPESAAVLTGGTTLTGTNRDEVEIDPLMRNRPGQPDVTKKDDKKKDDKKEDKKKDK